MTHDRAGSELPRPSRPSALRGAWRDLQAGGPRLVATKIGDRARRAWQLAKYDHTPRRLWRRPESVPIDRPIFILGVQGGGVTVLARCLYRHPRAVYASGDSRYWAGLDEIHNCPHIRDLPDPFVHRSYHFGNLAPSEPDHPLYGYQRAWLYAADDLLPRYRKTAADATPELRRGFRRVIQKCILAYARDPDRARFVDMSQLFTVQVPLLAALLDDCDPRFLLVARNPYATCSRAAQKEYGRDRGGYIEDDWPRRVACAVEHWSNSYRLALEASGRVPMLSLRYEDFLEDPERIVRRICDFVELPFDPEQVPAPHHRLPLGSVDDTKWWPLKRAENEKYLRDIDPRLVRMLNERAGDLVEALGYERMEV